MDNKEQSKHKHICKRIDKALQNQNQQIMKDGIRGLNKKYRDMEQEQENWGVSCLKDKIY